MGHIEIPLELYRKFEKAEEDVKSLTAQNLALQQEKKAYKEVLEDKRRLAREIDVILNGENAAVQASLCDLIPQIIKLQQENEELRLIAEWVSKISEVIGSDDDPKDYNPTLLEVAINFWGERAKALLPRLEAVKKEEGE